jgi:hypothetical protein
MKTKKKLLPSEIRGHSGRPDRPVQRLDVSDERPWYVGMEGGEVTGFRLADIVSEDDARKLVRSSHD